MAQLSANDPIVILSVARTPMGAIDPGASNRRADRGCAQIGRADLGQRALHRAHWRAGDREDYDWIVSGELGHKTGAIHRRAGGKR